MVFKRQLLIWRRYFVLCCFLRSQPIWKTGMAPQQCCCFSNNLSCNIMTNPEVCVLAYVLVCVSACVRARGSVSVYWTWAISKHWCFHAWANLCEGFSTKAIESVSRSIGASTIPGSAPSVPYQRGSWCAFYQTWKPCLCEETFKMCGSHNPMILCVDTFFAFLF